MNSAFPITTECEARGWLKDMLHVSPEAMEKLAAFAVLLKAEMQHQNLIAPSTFPHIWSRHIVDSAQLLVLAANYIVKKKGTWLDLGTGAGFPGIVIAILSDWNVVMVEERSRRAEYLQRIVDALYLTSNSEVRGERLEKIDSFAAAVISARAFAPLKRLVPLAARFSAENTLWLLPKGQSASKELEELDSKWPHMFHVKHSVTDTDARILAGYLLGKPKSG